MVRTTLAWLLALVTWSFSARAQDVPVVTFEQDVAAVLVRHCTGCHNGSDPKGGLDLTRRATALSGGESQLPAVTPEDSENSYLLKRIRAGEMPPAGKGQRVTPTELARLEAWIQAGAVWPADRVLSPFDLTSQSRAGRDWWSLQKPQRPAVPTVSHADRVRSPIDAFVLAKLEQHGLEPAREADRAAFIRRASFDLLGLPPTPREIEAFVSDEAGDAYEKLVDRLLSSPHYGERWARHWLDVVRFAESNGYETNTARANAWPYRDWVIRALNEDLPYPEFVFSQLAGDQREADAATGYLVGGAHDVVGSPDMELTLQQRMNDLDDMVSTTATAFLGLSVGCAKCHDHKFDPVAQRDYYALQAIFSGVQHGERELRMPESETSRRQLATLRNQLAEIEGRVQSPDPLSTESLPPDVADEVQRLRCEAERLRMQVQQMSPQNVYAGTFTMPQPTHVLYRGEPMQRRDLVAPGGIAAVGPRLALSSDAPEAERRVALAKWIGDPANPLTARVMVNRIWHYHFGQGLVKTPNDFGFQGGAASHPELLDWLATELMAQGWRPKAMHRQIMLSSTYRQASRFDAAAAAKDATGRLLWRFTPRRLEAEAIRDAILWTSGALDLRMGGPGYEVFEPNTNYVKVYTPKQSFGPAEWRRMVYQNKPRMRQDATFGEFDCPDSSQTTARRNISTTALQALNLMNSSLIMQQAELFAQRMERDAGSDRERQVRRAFWLAFGRPPDDDESTSARRLVAEQGLSVFCRALYNANEFLYLN